MRKIITFLVFGLALLAWPVQAQDYDESYVFVDKTVMSLRMNQPSSAIRLSKPAMVPMSSTQAFR